jgi:hypothetical protein
MRNTMEQNSLFIIVITLDDLPSVASYWVTTSGDGVGTVMQVACGTYTQPQAFAGQSELNEDLLETLIFQASGPT